MSALPEDGRGTPNRVVVVGSTGSGKTTLARELAQRFRLPHVELDALHWDSEWTPVAPAVFRERVARALADGCWVVDGNYRAVRDIVWPSAEMLIWLDYSLPVILWRLQRRTLARLWSGQQLWNGNRERFRTAFFSRDSLFVWALQTHGRRRKEYATILVRPEYAHLVVVHLRSPRHTREWLAKLYPSFDQETH